MMKNRRDFLRLAGVAPFMGVLGSSEFFPFGETQIAHETTEEELEPVYAGKDMYYWLKRLREPISVSERHRPDRVLRHFGKQAVPYLIEALPDEDDLWVYSALSEVHSGDLAPMLVRALKHRNPTVRHRATDVLRSIATRSCQSPALIETLEKAIPELINALHDNDALVVRAAIRLLGHYNAELGGKVSIPPRLLGHDSHIVRTEAAHYFMRFPPEQEEVRLMLVKMLKDPVRHVRWAAAEALSRVDPDHPGIVTLIVEQVKSGWSARAFESSDWERILEKALPALKEVTNGGKPGVLSALAGLLRNSRSMQVLKLLRDLAGNDHPLVRCYAIASLGHYEGRSRAAVPFILKALADEDETVRHMATSAMRQTVFRQRRRRCLPRLIVLDLMAILQHGAGPAKAAAVIDLGVIGPRAKEALPLLQEALNDKDSQLRAAAAVAICDLGCADDRVAVVLGSSLTLINWPLALHISNAIANLGPRARAAVPHLIHGMRNREAEYFPIRALGNIGPEARAAIPDLNKLLGDRQLGWDAAHALGRIGTAAIPTLGKAIRHGGLQVRVQAIEALGLIDPQAKQMVPVLIEKLSQGHILERIAAAEALGNIGSPAREAVPTLRSYCRNRDIALCNAVDKALAQIEHKPGTPSHC